MAQRSNRRGTNDSITSQEATNREILRRLRAGEPVDHNPTYRTQLEPGETRLQGERVGAIYEASGYVSIGGTPFPRSSIDRLMESGQIPTEYLPLLRPTPTVNALAA